MAAVVVVVVAAVVVEDMDGDMAKSCFVREDAGSVVPENFEPVEQAGVGLVDWMDGVLVDVAEHCVEVDDNSDSRAVSSEPVGVKHERLCLVG